MIHKTFINIIYISSYIFLYLGTTVNAQRPDSIFSGEAYFAIQSDIIINPDNDDNKTSITYLTVEITPRLELGNNFFIDGNFIFEPINDVSFNRNQFLKSEGLYVQELKFNYESGKFSAFIGKFNPNFGQAWDLAILFADLVEEYELTEKIGFGFGYSLQTNNLGTYNLSFSTFFADTSFLSDSAIKKRERLQKSDGGASNTEDFSSFIISLDGKSVGNINNLSYHIAYTKLANNANAPGGKDQIGVAANIGYAFDYLYFMNTSLLFEYIFMDHIDNGEDRSHYYTFSIINHFDNNWNIGFAYTHRESFIENSNITIDDDFVQISASYDFGNGWVIDFGWKYFSEDKINNNIIGTLVSYSRKFRYRKKEITL